VSVVARRYGPQAVILIMMLFLIVTYFFVMPKPVKDFESSVIRWGSVAAGFAMIVGAIDILRYHIVYLVRRTPGQWFYSLVLVVSLLITAAAGAIGVATGVGTTYAPFAWLYNNIYVPAQATIYSILVFYIASASFRAFRVRNAPALLLLITGLIVMFGNTSLGYVIWPGFTPLSVWLNKNIVAAAFRPIIIGAGLGIIITGLRTILGRELYRRE